MNGLWARATWRAREGRTLKRWTYTLLVWSFHWIFQQYTIVPASSVKSLFCPPTWYNSLHLIDYILLPLRKQISGFVRQFCSKHGVVSAPSSLQSSCNLTCADHNYARPPSAGTWNYTRLKPYPSLFFCTLLSTTPPNPIPHLSINIHQHPFNQLPTSLLSNLFQNMLIQVQVMRHTNNGSRWGSSCGRWTASQFLTTCPTDWPVTSLL